MVKMAEVTTLAGEKRPYNEAAGAALLALQDAIPTPEKVSDKVVQQWQPLRGHLEGRLNSLRMWRQTWWTQNYSQLAQYIEPNRSIWLTQSTGGMPSANNMTRGKPLQNSILDPTATYAARVCSAGIMSGLASPSRPWFKVCPVLKSVQIDAAGRAWMDEVEDRIYTVLAGSNFYNSFAMECLDLVVYGSAPVMVYEDKRDVIRLYNPACGEYYLASSATMRVEGLYRQFVMTIAQIVDFFGVENCPEDVQKMWQQKGGGLEVERVIAHSVEPNFAVANNKSGVGVIPGKFTWREVYWLYGASSEKPLSMVGYLDQPYSCARWETQSNDAYGRSVGMTVLPDVIQLQVMTARLAEAIEKQVRPPLLADASMKNQPSSQLPGHVTYVAGLSAGTGMRSIYNVSPDIKGMMELIAQIQARIKIGFFNDIILQLTSNPVTNRTAYETAAMLQEKLQVIGPVIENIIGDSLKVKLGRIFNIMKRRNLLPPMPDSMKAAGGIDVEFISMLALAQKASATGGLERLAAFIGNLVAVYPEAKDLMNIDVIIEQMNQLLDNPQNLLHGAEDLAKIRAIRAKQQQMVQKAQMLQHTAQTVNTGAQAAQTLAGTDIGGGETALSQLMGGGIGGKGTR